MPNEQPSDGWIQDLTWPEVEDLLRHTDVALLPVASIEGHGPHLPLSTDVDIAIGVARMAARRSAGRGRPVVVAPAIPFGVAQGFMGFPGTLTVSAQHLVQTIKDVGSSLHQHGIRNLLLVLGHVNNLPPMQIAGEELTAELGMRCGVANWFLPLASRFEEIFGGQSSGGGGHAGESETAIMLALRPETVHLDRLPPEPAPAARGPVKAALSLPSFSGGALDVARESFRADFPLGFMGNPAIATAEAGRAQLEIGAEWLCQVIEDQFSARQG